MTEREAMREREAEAKGVNLYEEIFKVREEEDERIANARVVIKGNEIPWEHGRQAILRWYTHPRIKDTALTTMWMFVHDIRSHSGRHRHQGGLALFVLEGKGYTTVDGVRHDWEKGDLILLPIKEDGVEHQHFNLDPDKPSRWLALAPLPLWDQLGWELTQVDTHPDWKGRTGG